MTTRPDALRPLLGEFLGSAGLAAIVIGSGVMVTRLSDDVGIQLLGNAWATALGLFVLIAVLGPVSGAQFNPAVSLTASALGAQPWRRSLAYLAPQVLGCALGAVLANLMFELPAVSISTTARATPGALLAEVLATAGLVTLIFVLDRSGRRAWIAPSVGAYIGAAYFFTSSTSFANPAITLGRMLSDSFAGIAPASAPWFIAAQLVGAGLAVLAVRALAPIRSGA